MLIMSTVMFHYLAFGDFTALEVLIGRGGAPAVRLLLLPFEYSTRLVWLLLFWLIAICSFVLWPLVLVRRLRGSDLEKEVDAMVDALHEKVRGQHREGEK